MQVSVEHEDASEVWIRVLSNKPPQGWDSVTNYVPKEVRQTLDVCPLKPFKWTPGQPSDWLDEGEEPDHDFEFEDFFFFKKVPLIS